MLAQRAEPEHWGKLKRQGEQGIQELVTTEQGERKVVPKMGTWIVNSPATSVVSLVLMVRVPGARSPRA